VCTIWWTPLLWRAMRSPCKCWFEHVESKCGHVSMALLGHSVQFGFGYRVGQKIFLRWFPMYWAYRSFKVYVIWASVVLGVFQNWLENLWLTWSLNVHFLYVCEFELDPP
jgi:hypothetical protein